MAGQVLPKAPPARPRLGAALEELYQAYTRPEFIAPDPIQFLSRYATAADCEIAGLVAASLAYGNVKQIVQDVGWALSRMTEAPAAFLATARRSELLARFRGFRHRWTTDRELVALLERTGGVLREEGSLRACFASGLGPADEDVVPALALFVARLGAREGERNSLLALPERGSACKRLLMYLRWMVRKDAVDPGGWTEVPPSKLIVPVDTHMHRIGRALRLTRRNQADLRTARELTAAFRQYAPDDPVRYDFALTRLGIRKEADLDAFLRRCA